MPKSILSADAQHARSAGALPMRRITTTALIFAGLILGAACTSALGFSRSSRTSHRAHSSVKHKLASTTARPFAPNSVWNEPLSAHSSLDPRSRAYVAQLVLQVDRDGPWINTSQFSTPVFTVSAHQRTVKVVLDNKTTDDWAALQASWIAVPVPRNARAAAGTDEHMVVWQPSTDRMWEFWQMHKVEGQWHAVWGGTIDHLSSNPGYYTDHREWGATATSLPLLGGLIRPSELAAGHIDHALALAVPAAQAANLAWPAERTDGYIRSPNEIPEGQHFRLDPKLDLNRISMPPVIRMMAVAAQKYGVIVRDQSGAVSFYAEDTAAEGRPDPYHALSGFFEDQYVNNLLKSFPWSHMQALKDTISCCWHK
jgi:hypothetical protein